MASRDNPDFLSADTIKGDKVVNAAGENVGKIEDLMIDLDNGRGGYAVLSFGGLLGMGDKLFAIPWQALSSLRWFRVPYGRRFGSRRHGTTSRHKPAAG